MSLVRRGGGGIASVRGPDGSASIYALDSLSLEGAVIRGSVPLVPGQDVPMTLSFDRARDLPVEARIIRQYHRHGGEMSWVIAFPRLSLGLETALDEALRVESSAEAVRPLMAIVGTGAVPRDRLREDLALLGWEAAIFATRHAALHWMDTSMVAFDSILIDALSLGRDATGFLSFLALRYPHRRRILLTRPGTDVPADALKYIDGTVDESWRLESLAAAMGLAPVPADGEPFRVLFVDDEPRVLEAIRSHLRNGLGDSELVWVTSAEEALWEVRHRRFRVVVSDLCMPGTDGVKLLSTIRSEDPSVYRVVLTGYELPEARDIAHRVLHKPCPIATIRAAILEGGRHPLARERTAT